MPESKKQATNRAMRLGYPKSNVKKAPSGGYFIAPLGSTKKGAKIYVKCRDEGGKKSTCAAVSHKYG